MTDRPIIGTAAEVHVVPYDDTWPELFRQEREVLSESIGEYVKGSIEHVGSTAVAGLVAKPVIDVMVGVESLAASRDAFPILKRLSYCYFPHHADVMHWFCKPSPQYRTHHLHLVSFRSRLWMERIAFRDYLRGHPEVAAEYGKLKQALAQRYRFDREAYTDAKKTFVRRIVDHALSREAPASG
ncbi:MAG TPA: GrpB family protein [Gammaproteobacteria bacterium]|nr:GrpB family protein [Gammaproteobacteria bacterium]